MERDFFTVNVVFEADQFFDESSIVKEGPPQMVMLLGGVAAGKTSIRKDRHVSGYVVVDAAEILRNLDGGGTFPGEFEEAIDVIGTLVAYRAVFERRHIVTELVGLDYEPVKELIEAMRFVGYSISVEFAECELDTAQERNLARDDGSASAFYTEPHHIRWLRDAAKTVNEQRKLFNPPHALTKSRPLRSFFS